jgi:hypothetical protein
VAGDSDGQIKPQDAFDGERRPTGPVFVFEPRLPENPEIDVAGRLFVNTFGRRVLKARARREVKDIIAHLEAEARAGRLPLDGVVIGWPGTGKRPLNAIDIGDAQAMRQWRRRALKVKVGLTMTERAPHE